MDWQIDQTILFRLLLASLLGGVIGLEREIHGRPAGFRTHLLVSLGSCLFVISSIQFYTRFGNFTGASPVGADPGRVAAQVVAGIGFLGAGAIIREKASIRGLTTAACLWVAAAIGLSCGIGMFGPAAVVTVLSLVSLLLLKRVENVLARDSYVHLKIWSDDSGGQQQHVENLIRECHADVVNVSIEKDIEAGVVFFEFELKSRSRKLSCHLLDLIAKIHGIKKVKLD
jgi:putative Mg2+ transporter-C (MgtC) family protein